MSNITPEHPQIPNELNVYKTIVSATGIGAFFARAITWFRSIFIIGVGSPEQKAAHLFSHLLQQCDAEQPAKPLDEATISLLAQTDCEVLADVNNTLFQQRPSSFQRYQTLIEHIIRNKTVPKFQPKPLEILAPPQKPEVQTEEEITTVDILKEAQNERTKILGKLSEELEKYHKKNIATGFPSALQGIQAFLKDNKLAETKAPIIKTITKYLQDTDPISCVKKGTPFLEVTTFLPPFGKATQSACLYEKLSPAINILNECKLWLSGNLGALLPVKLRAEVEAAKNKLKEFSTIDTSKQFESDIQNVLGFLAVVDQAAAYTPIKNSLDVLKNISKTLSKDLENLTQDPDSFNEMCNEACSAPSFNVSQFITTSLTSIKNQEVRDECRINLQKPFELPQEKKTTLASTKDTKPLPPPAAIIAQKAKQTQPHELSTIPAAHIPKLRSFLFPEEKAFFKNFPEGLDEQIAKGNATAAAAVLSQKNIDDITSNCTLAQQLFFYAYLSMLEDKPEKTSIEEQLLAQLNPLEEKFLTDLTNADIPTARGILSLIDKPTTPSEKYLSRLQKKIPQELRTKLTPVVEEEHKRQYINLSGLPSQHLQAQSAEITIDAKNTKELIHFLQTQDISDPGIYRRAAEKLLTFQDINELFTPNLLMPQEILILLDLYYSLGGTVSQEKIVSKFADKLFANRDNPNVYETLEFVHSHQTHTTSGTFYSLIVQSFCSQYISHLVSSQFHGQITTQNVKAIKTLKESPIWLLEIVCNSKDIDIDQLTQLAYGMVTDGDASEEAVHVLAKTLAKRAPHGIAISPKQQDENSNTKDFTTLIKSMLEASQKTTVQELDTFLNSLSSDSLRTTVLELAPISPNLLASLPSKNQHAELKKRLLQLDDAAAMHDFQAKLPKEWSLFQEEALNKLVGDVLNESSIFRQLATVPDDIRFAFFSSSRLPLEQRLIIAEDLISHILLPSNATEAIIAGLSSHTQDIKRRISHAPPTQDTKVDAFRFRIKDYLAAQELYTSFKTQNLSSIPISQLYFLCSIATSKNDSSATDYLKKQIVNMFADRTLPSLKKAQLLKTLPFQMLPSEKEITWAPAIPQKTEESKTRASLEKSSEILENRKQALLTLVDEFSHMDQTSPKYQLYASIIKKISFSETDPFLRRIARILPKKLLRSLHISGQKTDTAQHTKKFKTQTKNRFDLLRNQTTDEDQQTDEDQISEEFTDQTKQRSGQFTDRTTDEDQNTEEFIAQTKNRFGPFSGPNARFLTEESSPETKIDQRKLWISHLISSQALTIHEKIQALDNIIYLPEEQLSATERNFIFENLFEILPQISGSPQAIKILGRPIDLSGPAKKRVQEFHRKILQKYFSTSITTVPELEKFLQMLTSEDSFVSPSIIQELALHIQAAPSKNEMYRHLAQVTSFPGTVLYERCVALDIIGDPLFGISEQNDPNKEFLNASLIAHKIVNRYPTRSYGILKQLSEVENLSKDTLKNIENHLLITFRNSIPHVQLQDIEASCFLRELQHPSLLDAFLKHLQLTDHDLASSQCIEDIAKFIWGNAKKQSFIDLLKTSTTFPQTSLYSRLISLENNFHITEELHKKSPQAIAQSIADKHHEHLDDVLFHLVNIDENITQDVVKKLQTEFSKALSKEEQNVLQKYVQELSLKTLTQLKNKQNSVESLVRTKDSVSAAWMLIDASNEIRKAYFEKISPKIALEVVNSVKKIAEPQIVKEIQSLFIQCLDRATPQEFITLMETDVPELREHLLQKHLVDPPASVEHVQQILTQSFPHYIEYVISNNDEKAVSTIIYGLDETIDKVCKGVAKLDTLAITFAKKTLQSQIPSKSLFLQKVNSEKTWLKFVDMLNKARDLQDFQKIATELSQVSQKSDTAKQDSTQDPVYKFFIYSENNPQKLFRLFDLLIRPSKEDIVETTQQSEQQPKPVSTPTKSPKGQSYREHFIQGFAQYLINFPNKDRVGTILENLSLNIEAEKNEEKRDEYRAVIKAYVEKTQDRDDIERHITPLTHHRASSLILIEEATPQCIVDHIELFKDYRNDEAIVETITKTAIDNDLEDAIKTKYNSDELDQQGKDFLYAILLRIAETNVTTALAKIKNEKEAENKNGNFEIIFKQLSGPCYKTVVQLLSKEDTNLVLDFFTNINTESLDETNRTTLLQGVAKALQNNAKQIYVKYNNPKTYNELILTLLSILPSEQISQILLERDKLIIPFFNGEKIDSILKFNVALLLTNSRKIPQETIRLAFQNGLASPDTTLQAIMAKYLFSQLPTKTPEDIENTSDVAYRFWKQAEAATLLPVANAIEKDIPPAYRTFIVSSIASRFEELDQETLKLLKKQADTNTLYKDILTSYNARLLESEITESSNYSQASTTISSIPKTIRPAVITKLFTTQNVAPQHLIQFAQHLIKESEKTLSKDDLNALTESLLANVTSANSEAYKEAKTSLHSLTQETSKFSRVFTSILLPTLEQQLEQLLMKSPLDLQEGKFVEEKIANSSQTVQQALIKRLLSNGSIPLENRARLANMLFADASLLDDLKDNVIEPALLEFLSCKTSPEILACVPSRIGQITTAILKRHAEVQDKEKFARSLFAIRDKLSDEKKAELYSALFSSSFLDLPFLVELVQAECIDKKDHETTQHIVPLLEERLLKASDYEIDAISEFFYTHPTSAITHTLQSRMLSEAKSDQSLPFTVRLETLKKYVISPIPIDTQLGVLRKHVQGLSEGDQKEIVQLFCHRLSTELIPKPGQFDLSKEFDKQVINEIQTMLEKLFLQDDPTRLQSIQNILSHLPGYVQLTLQHYIDETAKNRSGEDRIKIRTTLQQMINTEFGQKTLILLEKEVPPLIISDSVIPKLRASTPAIQYEYFSNLNAPQEPNQRPSALDQLTFIRKLKVSTSKDKGDQIFRAFAKGIQDSDFLNTEFLDKLTNKNDANTKIIGYYAVNKAKQLLPDPSKAVSFFLHAPSIIRETTLKEYLIDGCAEPLKVVQALLGKVPENTLSIIEEALSKLQDIPESTDPSLNYILKAARTKKYMETLIDPITHCLYSLDTLATKISQIDAQFQDRVVVKLMKNQEIATCFDLAESPIIEKVHSECIGILLQRLISLDESQYNNAMNTLASHQKLNNEIRLQVLVKQWNVTAKSSQKPEDLVKTIKEASSDELTNVFTSVNIELLSLVQLGAKVVQPPVEEKVRQTIVSSIIQRILNAKRRELRNVLINLADVQPHSLVHKIHEDFSEVASTYLAEQLGHNKISFIEAANRIARLPALISPWNTLQLSTMEKTLQKIPSEKKQELTESLAQELDTVTQQDIIDSTQETLKKKRIRFPEHAIDSIKKTITDITSTSIYENMIEHDAKNCTTAYLEAKYLKKLTPEPPEKQTQGSLEENILYPHRLSECFSSFDFEKEAKKLLNESINAIHTAIHSVDPQQTIDISKALESLIDKLAAAKDVASIVKAMKGIIGDYEVKDLAQAFAVSLLASKMSEEGSPVEHFQSIINVISSTISPTNPEAISSQIEKEILATKDWNVDNITHAIQTALGEKPTKNSATILAKACSFAFLKACDMGRQQLKYHFFDETRSLALNVSKMNPNISAEKVGDTVAEAIQSGEEDPERIQSSIILEISKRIDQENTTTTASAVATKNFQNTVHVVAQDKARLLAVPLQLLAHVPPGTNVDKKSDIPIVQNLRTAQYFVKNISPLLEASPTEKELFSVFSETPAHMRLNIAIMILQSSHLVVEQKIGFATHLPMNKDIVALIRSMLANLPLQELLEHVQAKPNYVNDVIEEMYVEKFIKETTTTTLDLSCCSKLSYKALLLLIEKSTPDVAKHVLREVLRLVPVTHSGPDNARRKASSCIQAFMRKAIDDLSYQKELLSNIQTEPGRSCAIPAVYEFLTAKDKNSPESLADIVTLFTQDFFDSDFFGKVLKLVKADYKKQFLLIDAIAQRYPNHAQEMAKLFVQFLSTDTTGNQRTNLKSFATNISTMLSGFEAISQNTKEILQAEIQTILLSDEQ
jgi:hypothetical protein